MADGEYLQTIDHRGYKISTIHYGTYHGYIDHHGNLSTTPGSSPNFTDERAFQSEQAAINDAKFCIDLLLDVIAPTIE